MRAVVATLLIALAAPALAQIRDIRKFLDQCPQNDPAYAQIRSDFQIRRDGVIVSIPLCTEPVSAMPTSAYTDELIIMQALRVAYYMDRGMRGHLPWTDGTFYDWMKSRIGGMDVVKGFSFCCEYYGPAPDVPPPPPPGQPPPPPPPPRPFAPKDWSIGVTVRDDFNREFGKKWIGISGLIGLFGHETRHMDGFPHSSCCGIGGGCDDAFDASNLSPYGVQWWMDKLWLEGTINVGMSCMTPLERSEALNWFLSGVNLTFPERFCSPKPPRVVTPAVPGGACTDLLRRRAVARR
jgi:hypothetical protein